MESSVTHTCKSTSLLTSLSLRNLPRRRRGLLAAGGARGWGIRDGVAFLVRLPRRCPFVSDPMCNCACDVTRRVRIALRSQDEPTNPDGDMDGAMRRKEADFVKCYSSSFGSFQLTRPVLSHDRTKSSPGTGHTSLRYRLTPSGASPQVRGFSHRLTSSSTSRPLRVLRGRRVEWPPAGLVGWLTYVHFLPHLLGAPPIPTGPIRGVTKSHTEILVVLSLSRMMALDMGRYLRPVYTVTGHP